MLGTFQERWLEILRANDPTVPLQRLVQQFFSLLHLLGPEAEITPNLISNRIQAGDCLAHYLRRDLRAPQLMSPCIYCQQFQLALSTLANLEHLWEPPITTAEACTIFLHSFPHHMVLMFHNFLDNSFTPADLILDNIHNGMENIISIEPRKRPRQIAIGHGPPWSISCPDPLTIGPKNENPSSQ